MLICRTFIFTYLLAENVNFNMIYFYNACIIYFYVYFSEKKIIMTVRGDGEVGDLTRETRFRSTGLRLRQTTEGKQKPREEEVDEMEEKLGSREEAYSTDNSKMCLLHS